ncbi:MAG: DUF1538 domain-containing protein [Lachnospiraceae bacterium]|nr:DUF1538 domain-containing protein [Lachnospiraceae bacterium]
MRDSDGLKQKLHEALSSVLPIAAIVAILCFTIAPVPTDLMLSFVIGSSLLIVGLGLFMYGSDNSVAKIGAHIGATLTKSRNLFLILTLSFILGVIVTIAEPDLQVLAKNVPHINTMVLILTVSLGVGLFLMLCLMRILLGIQLKWLLILFYILIFILAALSDPNYLSVAFDAGGVTTGPMTSPFIIALGIGVASIRSDKNAEADSFGLVALCSVGPILAVLILGFFYPGEMSEIAAASASTYLNTVQLSHDYLRAIPVYLGEVALALAPIIVFFLLFQFFMLRLRRTPFMQILVGLGFTYIGLVVFLTGVNVGFSSLGVILGGVLAEGSKKVLLLPIVGAMGWFIISAEPAVHTLTRQVEEISAGSISKKSLKLSLSVGIAVAMMLALIRVLSGISILWFVLPGYILSLALSFFVPPIFTAIAFDSGGVASGPMSATFMLPLAMGVCQTVGGNILTDAFGIVAMVAMMPLITIQTMGAISVIRKKKFKPAVIPMPAEHFTENDVIELWL